MREAATLARNELPGPDLMRRLLDSARNHSHDPFVEIDWEAPPTPGLWAMSPEEITLYGTELWDAMSEERRLELARHEVVWIACLGIWLESVLMQMLLRESFRSAHPPAYLQQTLQEIAEECRHSMMFCRLAEVYGTPLYRPQPQDRLVIRLFKATARGPLVFAAALFAEETLDQVQRVLARDERVQPVTRTISRIHIAEEARHMRWARAEIRAMTSTLGPVRLRALRMLIALIAHEITLMRVNGDIYEAVGLDRREAVRQASRNPHFRTRKREGNRRVVEFFESVGLLGPVSRRILRRVAIL